MALLQKNFFDTYFDSTLLVHIMEKNNDEILSILQNVTDPCQLNDSFGNTLLHYAAKYGNKEFAQHLIDLGAVVDVRNQRRQTPLFLAVDDGTTDTARFLVEANADMLMPADCGQCPLARAFTHRRCIARALLDKVTIDFLKKNIEYVKSEEFHRDCQLRHFISLKNVEITRFLLENGSSVNAKSSIFHETALHVAAEQLDLENVKLLIEYGADVNAKLRSGETPLGRIPIENHYKYSAERFEAESKALVIVKDLLAAGATFTDSTSKKLMPRWLLMFGNREMVRTLLQGPIDWNFMDEYKETILHVLASNKHPDILEEVQDLESASKVRSVYGYTMLHRAAQRGNVNAIKHLLNNGADANAEDNGKNTPLCSALGTYWFYDDTLIDYLRSVEILLEHGAHPRLKYPHFEIERFKDDYDLLRKPVLAHIAMLGASGGTMELSLRKTIKNRDTDKKMFDLMESQVAEMKQTMIGESVTLFDFLIANEKKISFYTRNKRSIITKLTEHMGKDSLDSYYRRILRKNFLKFTELTGRRKKVVIAIDEAFNRLHNVSVYAVAEKIVNYLEDQELPRLLLILK